MSKTIIAGASDQQLSQIINSATFLQLSDNPLSNLESGLDDAQLCLTLSANALPGLSDTMTGRSYFENIKNRQITTLMHAVAAKELDQVNWLMYMGMVLPYVDIFYCTYKDALWLFENSLYEQYHACADSELCDQISLSILNMGCALVVFNLEEDGLYLRSSSVKPRLESMGKCGVAESDNWWARELYCSNCSECESDTYKKLAGLVDSLQNNLGPEEFLLNTAKRYCCKTPDNFKPAAAAFGEWKPNGNIAAGPYDKVEA